MISISCPAKDTFNPADCVATEVLWEREKLEDRDNAVDISDAPLLIGPICSLVKEGSTNRGTTDIEKSGCNSLLVETEASYVIDS